MKELITILVMAAYFVVCYLVGRLIFQTNPDKEDLDPKGLELFRFSVGFGLLLFVMMMYHIFYDILF